MDSEEEEFESPWDGETPSYRKVPERNPKTGEPVQFYLCGLCGGAVISRKLHSKAHRNSQLPSR